MNILKIKPIVILALCAALLTNTSCEDDSHIYEGPNYVEFPVSRTSTSLPYNFMGSELVRIKTQIIGAQGPENRSVNFEVVEGDGTTAQEGVNYSMVSPGSFAIEANSSFGYIELNAIGDALAPGSSVSIALKLLEGDLPISPNYQDATHTISKMARPEIGFDVPSATLSEANAGDTVSFALKLNAPALTDLSVSYNIAGNAIEGTDYRIIQQPDNPLTVEAGVTEIAFQLALINDLMVEDDSIVFEVVSATPATNDDNDIINTAAPLSVKIVDDVKEIGFQAGDTLVLSTDDIGNILIPVMLTEGSSEMITVDYTISGGIAGTDYTDLSAGVVRFSAKNQLTNIALEILEAAFEDKNTVLTLTLDGIATTDQEVSLKGSPTLAIAFK